MTISLEKIFFAYIINNKRFLPVVESYFFKNREIEFVYNIIRNYMVGNNNADLPSNKQILEMVQLEDLNGMITRELLKGMLSVNLGDYDEVNFVVPRLNAWIMINRIKAGTVDVVEATRDMDNLTDFEDVIMSANKIKEIVNNMSNTNFVEDDDLGSDFDDPEAHYQDNAAVKISTGFTTLDHVMGSGWDRSTLNVLMGETNSGKCTFFPTKITIRHKETGLVKEVEIGSLFTKVSNGDTNI